MGGYDGHRGCVNFLAVHPDFRENGYGQKIMNSVETEIRKMGCPKINLHIRKGNDKISSCYQNTWFYQRSCSQYGKTAGSRSFLKYPINYNRDHLLEISYD